MGDAVIHVSILHRPNFSIFTTTFKVLTFRMKLKHKTSAVALILALGLMGCQKNDGVPRGYVSGKVTYTDGSPVTLHKVVFANEETGVGGSSHVGEDGRYSIQYKGDEGIPSGSKYMISVKPDPPAMTPEEYNAYMNASAAEQAKIDQDRMAQVNAISEKYWSMRTSGFEYQVEEGDQTFDIEIEK